MIGKRTGHREDRLTAQDINCACSIVCEDRSASSAVTSQPAQGVRNILVRQNAAGRNCIGDHMTQMDRVCADVVNRIINLGDGYHYTIRPRKVCSAFGPHGNGYLRSPSTYPFDVEHRPVIGIPHEICSIIAAIGDQVRYPRALICRFFPNANIARWRRAPDAIRAGDITGIGKTIRETQPCIRR